MKNGNASIRILGTITGLVVTVFLIAGGWFAMKTFTRASDEVPREVIVAEITSNSAKITWSTGQESQGVVEYGTSPTSLNFFAPESEKKLQHTVDLTLLSPNTTYYFQIRVGDTKYDNGGVPWTFTTKLTDSDNGSTQENKPSPIQTLKIGGGTTTGSTCNETNCEIIKSKLGKGCSTQDFIKCLKKNQ